jgi:nucleotide-binding universal stress UspA family protein
VTIAKILVPATGTPRDDVAIATALQAAKLFNAHVQVQFVHPDPAEAVPLVGVPLAGEAMQAIIDGQTEFAQAAATRARESTSAVCRREDIDILKSPECRDNATCSFRQLWGNADRTICDAAKLSDLVVFGPVRWRDSPEINEAFLDVLRTVRRPVLVANHAPRGPFRKIAIGWDGSAFAAHAICSAMPFLQHVERTIVIVVHRRGAEPVPTQEVVDYLSRHGVSHELRVVDAADKPPAEALMAEARVAGADMLVAGGYGHDHLWETFFGGVTEKLLAQSDIPVLFAH